jgi:hypothetical protein
MKLRNYLRNFLFKTELDQWLSWKLFAKKYNFLYSILEDNRPIMRGSLGGRSIAIQNINLGTASGLKMICPIHNPRLFYLLIEDKNILNSLQGIFDKKLTNSIKNKDFEKKYSVKTNSEFFTTQFLADQTILNKLLVLNLSTIEIHNFEIVFTKYTTTDFGKDFIEELKIFLEFLSYYDEFTLKMIQV